jgi:alkanesulfonate monooxygenase SsuD/methylene tetrahydromethanopterin reductase-like flavin-dependent oxidoreductase (luciferase family)
MIGGSGEQKTLRMVAEYADHGNLTCERAEVPRKVAALAEHCTRIRRDRSDVTLSWLRRVCVAPTLEMARDELWAFLGARGLDRSALSDDDAAVFEANFVLGDPDQVAEVLRSDLSLGIDGYVVSLVANGHIEGRVELLGAAGRAAFAGRR